MHVRLHESRRAGAFAEYALHTQLISWVWSELPKEYHRLAMGSPAEAFTTTLWLSIYFEIVARPPGHHLADLVVPHPGRRPLTRPDDEVVDAARLAIGGAGLLFG